jgi:hypothetical protein
MVSEPINPDATNVLGATDALDVRSDHALEAPATPASQPRWMSISVPLVGIIGLVVMIFLVRG